MYSLDFRICAINNYLKFKSSRKVAKIMNIHYSTVCRWIKCLHPKKRRIRKQNTIIDTFITTLLSSNPLLTQQELVTLVKTHFSISCCSRHSIRKSLKRIQFTRKKVKKKRSIFYNQSNYPLYQYFFDIFLTSKNIVCIDESGFSERHVSLKGYSKIGSECVLLPSTTNFQATLVLAISNTNQKWFKIQKSPCNGESFLEFLKSLELPKDTVIVLDNCRIHKTKEVLSFATTKNWILLFTPPYSPDCNPVEMIFGLLKGKYRKDNIRSVAKIEKLLSEIPSETIRNAYEHVKNILQKH
jgi:transposase